MQFCVEVDGEDVQVDSISGNGKIVVLLFSKRINGKAKERIHFHRE